MKMQIRFLTLFAALTLMAAPAVNAQITAGNVRAAQRTGTKLVDIDYDLSGTTNPAFVALEISADGGTTWSVPATTLTGAVGTNITPGTNLRITWDAGADWNNQTSSQTRFRLRVSGDLLPDQAVFSLIPAGDFTMGDSLDGMADAPPHTVNVSAFYMQKTEVTKAEWDAVRDWGSIHGYADLASGVGTAANHPVQAVSWYDVVKWCNARSEMENLTPCYYTDAAQTAVYRTGNTDIDNTMVKWTATGYCLPTEAEWEKAARGGLSGKRYPLGDSITPADANYSSGGTVVVGSYAPNGYGLYDTAGNVYEWCWDWYNSNYYNISPTTDPLGPAAGPRVLRGGGWGAPIDWCRVAVRSYFHPSGTPEYGFGFRTVRRGASSFALIPGGSFTMGDSLDGMTDAPPHTVNVSTFSMQKTEVTKAEWDTVRDWGTIHGYTDLAVGEGYTAADHPVQAVSWYDVVKWCNARSEKDGLTPCYYTDAAQPAVFKTGTPTIDNTMVKWSANGYRLPTEAEWEKAARGGLSGKRYPLGDSITPLDANYNSFNGTVVVGTYAPNGYGIYDMAGNAFEWCWDWYSDAYYGSPESLTDPFGPSGSYRVLRGGDWGSTGYYNGINDCVVALRRISAVLRSAIGFRPVRANLVTADSPSIAVNTKDPILTINALHGTVPGAGQYEMNTTVELTPTPDTGYLFSKWTGDATGSANPMSVTMDSDKTITAVFAQDTRDPDGDGLTNYQELVVYHTNPDVVDTDGDGFSDGYEVLHGTSPIDSNSRPDTRMEIFTAVEVRFPSAMGQPYRIESSTDLQNWSAVADGVGVDGSGNIVHGGHITGTGDTITLWYTIQEIPKRYFRAVRE